MVHDVALIMKFKITNFGVKPLLALGVITGGGIIYLNSFGEYGLISEKKISEEVFPAGTEDLGEFFAHSTKTIMIEVVNPLAREVFVFGLNPTCGCILAQKRSGVMQPGDKWLVEVQIKPKADGGAFKERLVLQASAEELDGASLSIIGNVNREIVAIKAPDFSFVNSEAGGRAYFELSIPALEAAEKASIFAAGQEQGGLLTVHSSIPGTRFEVDHNSVEIDETTLGGVFISGAIDIAPSSLRGRIDGVNLVLSFPEDLGGGYWTLPITGALLSSVTTSPPPELSSESLASLKEVPAIFEIDIENALDSSCEFIERSGLVKGIQWEITENHSGEKLLSISGEVVGHPNNLFIPYILNGKEGNLIVQIGW